MRYCKYCGKEVADKAVICLNCGCEIKTRINYSEDMNIQQSGDDSIALWSMICGLVSFFIGWFALGITAIVLANISKKDSGVRNPMATAGFICGIISTVIYSFIFILIIAILVSV